MMSLPFKLLLMGLWISSFESTSLWNKSILVQWYSINIRKWSKCQLCYYKPSNDQVNHLIFGNINLEREKIDNKIQHFSSWIHFSHFLARMKGIFIGKINLIWVLLILMTGTIAFVISDNNWLSHGCAHVDCRMVVPMLIDAWICKLIHGLKEEAFYP